MPIDWNKIQANLSGGSGGTPQNSRIDWKKISDRLPKPIETKAETPVKPVTMPSAEDNARSLFSGTGFQAFGKNIMPYKEDISQQIALPKSSYNPFASMDSVRPPVTTMPGSTPMVDTKALNPIETVFGAVRAVSDYLSFIPASIANVSSFKDKKDAPKSLYQISTPSMIESTAVDTKYLVDAVKENARLDIESGGSYTINKASQDYLSSRGVVKGGNAPTVQDFAVLGSLGFFDMFGDIVLGVPGTKAAKEFLVWKNVGRIEKPLKEGTTITKGITQDLRIGENVKIKIKPKENSVIFEGYIKRGSKGEIVNNPLEISGLADEVAKTTGKDLAVTTKGGDLVLSAKPVTTDAIETGNKLVFGTADIAKPQVTINPDIPGPVTVKAVQPKEFKTAEEYVKAQGTPLYHGTNAEFDVFDKNKIGSATDEGYFGKGFYFANTEPFARIAPNGRGASKIMEIYPAKDIKLFNISEIKTKKEMADLLGMSEDALTQDGNGIVRPLRGQSAQFTSRLQDLGYDGAVVRRGGDAIETVIFEPDKIKTKSQLIKEWNQAQNIKAPTIDADKGGYAEVPTKKAEYKSIETPELYKMVKQIDKDMPISVKNYRKFLGVFSHGGAEREKIGLSRELFKTKEGESPEVRQQRIAKTFAHEIGHYVDYLPDKNIKRGNLNGRLLVVNDFRKNFVDDEAILKKRTEIKRQISKIVNDPVLMDGKIKELTEPLRNDLAEIDSKIRFNNSVFKDELVKLSKEWKPWTEGVDDNYDLYRKSAPELYADFVSVLFNNPGLAEEVAPKFYDEFFKSLDKKPEVQKAFLEIQAELNGDRPSLMAKRWEMLKESGLNAQGKFAAMVAEGQATKKSPWLTNLKRDAWYQHYWAKNVSKKAEYTMEEYDRGFNNGLYVWANKELAPIFKDMQKAGIDSNDLDAVLKLERMASDVTREGVANIKGLDQKTSEDVLQELTNIVGEDKAAALFKAADRLRLTLRDVQLKYPDLWKPETKELINSNKFYSPFNVLFSESQNIPYYIKQSKGNIDKDFNAVTNTLLRAKAVINFGERNLAKKTVIDEMISNGFKDIKSAKKNVMKLENGQVMVEFEKTPKDMDLVQIKRDGELEGYFMPKDIATSLNQMNVGELASVLKPFRAMLKPFKKLYTELNPAFQVVNFLFRDWGQASMFFGPEWSRAQLSKGVSTPHNVIANNTYRYILSQFKQGKYYYKALKNVKEKNLFQKYTPIVEEALKNHIIEVDGTGMYKLDQNKLSKTEEQAVDYILQTMGLTSKANGWKRVGEVVRGIGQTLEETPKLAAYMYMKDIGLMAGEESAKYKSIIRNYVGSPNFWKRGKNAQEISSLMMFYNPIIRGQENLVNKAFIKDAAGKGSRTAFWWRMIRKALIPALVTVAAEEGFFGDDIKKEYNKNPEYLKNNYYTIPIGETDGGKIKSITIPLDEDTRLIHALTRMAAKAALHGGDRKAAKQAIWDILSYTGGQIPSTNPVITIGSTWGTALGGGNPYDSFRQQHIFLANEEKLPFSEKAKILTRWTLNQSGQLKLDLRDGIQNKSIDEQTIQYTPVVNRFYRITDRGDYEMDQAVAKDVEQQEAMRLLGKTKELNSITEKLGRGEKVDVATEITQLAKDRLGAEANDPKKYNKEVKLLLNSLQDKYISSFGNVHFKSLMNASNDQKEAILIDIHGRDTMSNSEYQRMINDALQLKIINQEVANNVLNSISGK